MEQYSTIAVRFQGSCATVTLNRQEVHNAMDIAMIRELTDALKKAAEDPATRVVVLNGGGANFSAGADLHWMKAGLEQDRDQLQEESMELAGLFRLITEIGPVVVASVRGRVAGGAIGLVAASDLVIAEATASFRFPEVKLGLIPATVAPFVVRKTGSSAAAGWMLTGREFSTEEAMDAGLVHFTCRKGDLTAGTDDLLEELLSGGPQALKDIKKILRDLPGSKDPDALQAETAMRIASSRISKEGQEGIRSFLEKRKPGWADG